MKHTITIIATESPEKLLSVNLTTDKETIRNLEQILELALTAVKMAKERKKKD